jgi:hypothetical protein
MNLILSNKVAKRFLIEFNLDGDFTSNINNWRVDCVELGKRSIFIITNEPTLYTCISSFRSGFNGIIQRLTKKYDNTIILSTLGSFALHEVTNYIVTNLFAALQTTSVGREEVNTTVNAADTRFLGSLLEASETASYTR